MLTELVTGTDEAANASRTPMMAGAANAEEAERKNERRVIRFIRSPPM
jgi:hypothetical protein